MRYRWDRFDQMVVALGWIVAFDLSVSLSFWVLQVWDLGCSHWLIRVGEIVSLLLWSCSIPLQLPLQWGLLCVVINLQFYEVLFWQCAELCYCFCFSRFLFWGDISTCDQVLATRDSEGLNMRVFEIRNNLACGNFDYTIMYSTWVLDLLVKVVRHAVQR